MENLQDYIETAIKNGLTQSDLNEDEWEIRDHDWRIEWGYMDEFYEDISLNDKIIIWTGGEGQEYGICNLIMSRKFIEKIIELQPGNPGSGNYYTLEEFTNKQAEAIREGKIEEFIQKL